MSTAEVVNINKTNVDLSNLTNIAQDETVNEPTGEPTHQDVGPFNEALENQLQENLFEPQPEPQQYEERLEDRLTNRRMIHKVKRYFALFPAELGDLKAKYGSQLEFLSYDDIRMLADECEFTVSLDDNVMMNTYVQQIGANALEGVLLKAGMKVNGLGTILGTDPQIDKNMRELSLKYDQFCYRSPEWRLFQRVCFAAYAIHSTNSQLASSELANTARTKAERAANVDIPEDKYADL